MKTRQFRMGGGRLLPLFLIALALVCLCAAAQATGDPPDPSLWNVDSFVLRRGSSGVPGGFTYNGLYNIVEAVSDIDAIGEDDYTSTVCEVINSGSYSVTISPAGRFAGLGLSDLIMHFTVTNHTLTASDFKAIPDQYYTGSAITLSADDFSFDYTLSLTLGTDFTATDYKENTNPGEASVLITPINSCEGASFRLSFNIVKYELQVSDFKLNPDLFIFTGEQITPDSSNITIVNTDRISDGDYYIHSYGENIYPATGGEVTIYATDNGKCTGEVTLYFDIEKVTAQVSFDSEFEEYTGEEINLVAYYPTIDGNVILDITGIVGTSGAASGDMVFKDPGDYAVEVAFKADDPNTAFYDLPAGPHKATIKRKTVDVIFTGLPDDKEYDGEGFSTENVEAMLYGVDNSRHYIDVALDKPDSDVGTYTFTAIFYANAIYEYGPEFYSLSEATAQREINPKNVNATFSGLPDNKPYDGEGFSTTGVTASYLLVGGGTQALDVDLLSSSADVGTYDFTANFKIDDAEKGNYTLSGNTATRDITPKAITDVDGFIITGDTGLVYNGSAQRPDVDHPTLKKHIDYGVQIIDTINAGSYLLSVLGIGNYTGEMIVPFDIDPRPIDDVDGFIITGDKGLVYNGSAQQPDVDHPTLVAGIDYLVNYFDSINAGSYILTFNGIGNYTNERNVVYDIAPQPIAPSEFTITGDTGLVYDGAVRELTIKHAALEEGTDYVVQYSDNVNAGTASYTVSGIGNYTGNFIGTFDIAPQPIAPDEFTVPGDTDLVYNGSAQEPPVGHPTLVKDVDYKVAYGDNINSGTAAYTVMGTGNYSGEFAGTFNIARRPIVPGEFTVSGLSGLVYNGAAQEVTIAHPTLVQGRDYMVTFSDNIDAGNATCAVTGIGNYTGETEAYFTIAPQPIEESDFTLPDVSGEVYTGSAILPVVESSLGLADWSIEYGANTNAGDSFYTLKGEGNYTGEITVDFIIRPKPLTSADITVTGIDAGYSYKVAAIAPAPTVTDDGRENDDEKTLIADKDYAVAYADNTDIGTASVTITGQGNYAGQITRTFTIAPRPFKPGEQAFLSLDGKDAAAPDGLAGWYVREVFITAPAGYTLAESITGKAAAESAFTAALTYPDGDYTALPKTYSLRDTATGEVLAAQTIAYKQDTTPPAATVDVDGVRLTVTASDPGKADDVVHISKIIVTRNGEIFGDTVENAGKDAMPGPFACEIKELKRGGDFSAIVCDEAGNACDPLATPVVDVRDSDGDGLSDAYEKRIGTDPDSKDTDGDGLSDYREDAIGTDPLDRDTNNNGISDGDEAAAGFDPMALDSDEDGIDDAVAMKFGWTPKDKGEAPLAARLLLRGGDYDGAGDNGATALDDPEALAANLRELADSGYLKPADFTELDRGERRAAGERLRLARVAFTNEGASDPDKRRGIAVQDGKVLVFTAGSGRFNVERGIDVSAAFGDILELVVLADNSGSMLLIANWNPETKTCADDLLLVDTLNDAAYTLTGSAGASRFAIAPDGSRVGYQAGGDIRSIRFTGALEAPTDYAGEGYALLGYTADGQPILGVSDGQATLGIEEGEGKGTTRTAPFDGLYDVEQPTNSRRVLANAAGDTFIIDGEVGFRDNERICYTTGDMEKTFAVNDDWR